MCVCLNPAISYTLCSFIYYSKLFVLYSYKKPGKFVLLVWVCSWVFVFSSYCTFVGRLLLVARLLVRLPSLPIGAYDVFVCVCARVMCASFYSFEFCCFCICSCRACRVKHVTPQMWANISMVRVVVFVHLFFLMGAFTRLSYNCAVVKPCNSYNERRERERVIIWYQWVSACLCV